MISVILLEIEAERDRKLWNWCRLSAKTQLVFGNRTRDLSTRYPALYRHATTKTVFGVQGFHLSWKKESVEAGQQRKTSWLEFLWKKSLSVWKEQKKWKSAKTFFPHFRRWQAKKSETCAINFKAVRRLKSVKANWVNTRGFRSLSQDENNLLNRCSRQGSANSTTQWPWVSTSRFKLKSLVSMQASLLTTAALLY